MTRRRRAVAYREEARTPGATELPACRRTAARPFRIVADWHERASISRKKQRSASRVSLLLYGQNDKWLPLFATPANSSRLLLRPSTARRDARKLLVNRAGGNAHPAAAPAVVVLCICIDEDGAQAEILTFSRTAAWSEVIQAWYSSDDGHSLSRTSTRLVVRNGGGLLTKSKRADWTSAWLQMRDLRG